jgi:signal transduction histidine kinase
MFLVLSVPTAVVVWNVVLPSSVGKTVKIMQENRVKDLLYYIDETINKTELYNLKNSTVSMVKVEENLKGKIEPHSRSSKGIKIGIYIPITGKFYTYGTADENWGLSPARPPQDKFFDRRLMEDLGEVLTTRADKINYISFNDIETLRYLHPVKVEDEVVAVTWGESILPPQINTTKRAVIYILFFASFGLIIGFVLMLIIVNNLNRNIISVRNGLETMSQDLSFRLEEVGGDIGKITQSINTMAETLEEKEKLEEQLIRTEKLASLGHMISGVAHEIRNPLSIIRGTVQLMERNFKNVQGLEEYIKIVKEQSDRENRVIQELLDYSRPSRQILVEIDVNTLIKSVLSFTNKYVQDKYVKLELKLEENLPKLHLDCDKIKQVFVNIIINACEAMDKGGTLNIITKKEDQWVKIYFEDTGIGMDEAQLKNLFNPYYTTKPKGTGLGLAISNGIIELHGGGIEVRSKKGEGTAFIVRLPSLNKAGEDNG